MNEPTPEQILENLPLCGGRISVAIDEIVRLIQTRLPGVVDLCNATYGTKIQKPKSVRIVPQDINDVDLDEILIEFSIAKRAHGPGIFTDVATVMIHSIDERIVQGRHIQNVQDRGDLLAACLYPNLTDSYNPAGLRVWSELAPQGKAQLPGEWKKYSGTTLTYQLVQNMNDGWS